MNAQAQAQMNGQVWEQVFNNILTIELKKEIDNYYRQYQHNKNSNFHYFNNGDSSYCLECKPGFKVELKDIG